MKPKSIEDFIPMMEIDSSELINYIDRCQELIYYFSEKLNVSLTYRFPFSQFNNSFHFVHCPQIPAGVVAAHMTEHRDVFFKGRTTMLKRKLDVLLEHHVDPLTILNCRMTFRISINKIKEIIGNLQNNGIEKISSWMIIPNETPEYIKYVSAVSKFTQLSSIFERYNFRVIESHMNEKNSLDGFKSSIEYISNRLNWDETDREVVLSKYPSLPNCSAKKVN